MCKLISSKAMQGHLSSFFISNIRTIVSVKICNFVASSHA